MPESRRRRPRTERTEPERTMNGRRKENARPKTSAKGDHAGQSQRRKGNAREAGYQAVNDAYRLIDEYLRQGQRMAENLWLPLAGLDTDEQSQFKAPERFMRAMSDMTMSWVELMQQWTTKVQPSSSEAPTGGAAPFTAGRVREPKGAASEATSSRASSLRVAVESRGRVEVSVHVADVTKIGSLEPSALRPFQGNARPIGDVKLEQGSKAESPMLRIRVPDGQPSGAYNGLLVERGSKRPRGTVSLLIL